MLVSANETRFCVFLIYYENDTMYPLELIFEVISKLLMIQIPEILKYYYLLYDVSTYTTIHRRACCSSG